MVRRVVGGRSAKPGLGLKPRICILEEQMQSSSCMISQEDAQPAPRSG